ncbi:hypothetical protein NLI96_g7658 [Meripilus lineatus]|uniref:Uncharacterized protein n=1 Tax=Meripilus lineatus TaxID=2056292 RepID=A0AAD5V3X7_9APHY|nr:hypothetical protein NLI96_g7658 [Physisporinus lineatus]
MLFHFGRAPGPLLLRLRWSEFERFVREIGNFLLRNVVGGVPIFRTVYLHGGGGIALSAWHEELFDELRLGTRDEDPAFKLVVRMPGIVDSHASSFRLLCGSLPLSEVRTGFFVIPYKVVPMSSSWHGFLNSMGEIRHFSLCIPNPVYFCRALSKRSEAHQTLLLPKLETLALYSAQFLQSQHPLRCTAFQQIDSWLRLRADRGYKIPTLEFREAVNFQEGDLDMLRDCADEVVWDNGEQLLYDPPRAIPAELSADDLEPHLLVDQAYISEVGH